MFFKRRLKYNDIIKLICQIGYERYMSLNNALIEEYSYNEQYFYLIFQIINCFIFQRILKLRNIIDSNENCFKNASDIIINSIQSEFEDDILLAYIQIVNEIEEIWKNDNDDNSYNEVYNTANYLVNEILECEDVENIDLKRFFTQYFTDCYFENKELIKNVKYIE